MLPGLIHAQHNTLLVPPSYAYTASATSTSDLTTYTFSSQSLGTADATRYIVVGVGGTSSPNRTISSVTIGGVSATEVITNNGTDGSGYYFRASLYIAAVPAGTTGNVVVTWSGAMVRCGIGVWALYNLTSSTAADTGISTANPATDTLSSALSGDIVIGFVNCCRSASTTFTWTNATERFDTNFETVQTVSGADATAAGSITVTATPSAAPTVELLVLACWR